jgi:hypothetical protein
MPDDQRLAPPAEEDLVVAEQSGKPDRVDPDITKQHPT